MKSNISVEPAGNCAFRVKVTEGTSQSEHQITLKTKDYQRMTAGKIGPGDLVRASFEFLLQHESKESILPRFDLMEIARYFPDFEREITLKVSKP